MATVCMAMVWPSLPLAGFDDSDGEEVGVDAYGADHPPVKRVNSTLVSIGSIVEDSQPGPSTGSSWLTMPPPLQRIKRRRLCHKQLSDLLDPNPAVGDMYIQDTFRQMLVRSNEVTRNAEKDTVKGDGTIIDSINHYMEEVIEKKYKTWPDYVKRLAVAILMT